MKNNRIKWVKWILFGFAIILNAYIIMQSCLNANDSTNQSGFVFNIVKTILNGIHPNAINDGNANWWHGFIRKAIGHFGLFAFDGVMTSWALYYFLEDIKQTRKWWIKIIISAVFGLLIASITEIIQLVVPGRAGDIKDVLIDYGGYVLGLGIIVLIYWLIYRHRNKKEKQNNL